MKTTRTIFLMVLLGVALDVHAGPVVIPEKLQVPPPPAALRNSSEHGVGSVGTFTANEAARRAQAINGGGKVLSVDDLQEGWRVKLLKDGNVRVVQLPH